MPATGRQRWIVEATWGAATTVPSSYTFKQISPDGKAINAKAALAIDLSDVAMIGVIFPATIAAAAVSLKFTDAPTIDGTYVPSLDENGNDIVVSGVQSSKSKSRSINLALCSRFFVKPVFMAVDGSTPAAPGAVTVTFLIKE